MVDKITSCSIDFETALEILNNFFKTKDVLDSYATLDFVDINLSSGKLNLYKKTNSREFVFLYFMLFLYSLGVMPTCFLKT